MARNKLSRGIAAVCLSGTLAAAGVITFGHPSQAAPKATKATGNTEARAKEQPSEPEAESLESGASRNIRLNYIQASWTSVLRDYAKAVDMTLVADRAPSSKFTRMDRTQYSPSEALKILNRELEMHGFRLIQKGNFLILIELPSFRTEYPRPVVTPDGHAMANPAAAAQREVELLDPPPRAAKTPSRVVQADAQLETRRPSRLSAHPIRLASATSDDAFEESGEANDDIENAVKLTNHKASKLAKTLYEGFKSKARLIDEGPQGLPAFRVYHNSPDDDNSAPRVRFTVSIDDDANELIVQGTRLETRAVGRLIKVLDGIAPVAGTSVKTMTVSRDAGKVAEILQPELNRLSAATRRARYENNVGSNALAQVQDQPNAPRNQNNQPVANQPAAAQPEQAPGDPLQNLVGGLKAEVTIESIPELGVMIIRGNEADVLQVQEIIKQIEKAAEGTIPRLEILMLQHVSSEGLATLLTSVYDRLSPVRTATARVGGAAAATSTVTILPIARPNAIMIIAPDADMENVKELATQLDQPIDPQTDYQIFRLKYAIASQVVTSVGAVYPAAGAAAGAGGGGGGGGAAAAAAANAGALTPRVRISADVRTNSVIVVARPRDLQEVAKLISELDKNESAAVNQMRIFPLKNATATDLATILQQSIQSVLQPPQQTTTQGGGLGQQFGGGGQQGLGGAQGGATQLRDVKSSVIQFMATDGTAQRLLRSGILADIRVTADGRTNSIVVTASEESMPLMEELIKQLDRPTAAVAEIKVFTLANGDATQMVTLLQGLFPTQQTGQQGGQGGFGGQGGNQFGQQIQGLQLAGADDVNSGLIPLRLSVDVRTNSIIAVGSADTLNVVYAILLRLDESDIQQRKTEVFRLKNISAASVSTSINLFLTTQRQVLTQAQPDLLSPFEQIEREVVVVPETVSNNLLISATPRYFDDIVAIVKKLDTPPQQVIIQALLVEVALDNTDEFGVELGLQDSILFKRSLATAPVTFNTSVQSPNGNTTTTQNIVGQAATPAFLFNNAQLGNNVGNLFLPSSTGPNVTQPNTVGGQGLSHFSLGRTNNDLGYGGLVLSAGSESVSVLLRALAARRRVDVLSRPQIRTLDNQLAQIQVGQQVPTVSGAQTNAQTGVANPTITQRQTGIILTVTPRISPDQMVVMELIAEKSAINGSVPLLSGTTAGTAVLQSPIFDVTTARTVISVRDGQTIVLGGMITKNDETQERKVPILGDIPVLGLAFRYDLKKFRRTELLMFLTPRIIRNDGESELIKQIETERIHFIEQDAENLHGPILAVPGTEHGPLPGEAGFPLPPVLPPEVNSGATIVPPSALEPPPVPPKSGDRSYPNRTPGPMRGLQVPEFEDTMGDARKRTATKQGGVQPANYAAEAAPTKSKTATRR